MNIRYTDMFIEGNWYRNTPLNEFTKDDLEFFQKIYSNWRDISKSLQSINARGVNLPEGLSEGLFSLYTGFLRMNGVNLPGVSSSFDCYDPINHKRIQVKACSVIPDLSSFGPNSKFDDLYFMDFYREGKWDGSFDIYYIPSDLLYNIVLNQKENKTFRDQQIQGRRPRLSLYKLAKSKGIEPKTFSLFR